MEYLEGEELLQFSGTGTELEDIKRSEVRQNTQHLPHVEATVCIRNKVRDTKCRRVAARGGEAGGGAEMSELFWFGVLFFFFK